MSLGGVFRKSILLIFAMVAFQSFALTVEKKDFADTMESGGKKLVLNGAGLRTKRKFGMNFRVYVAGLYVTAKSSDEKALVASDDPKFLRMIFLRSLDRDTLVEAWEDGFNKNCKKDCETLKPFLKKFSDLMVPVKEDSEMTIAFDKDGAQVSMKAKESKSGKVDSGAFSKALLAVFIGDDPPTEEFKKALLGKN
jgi:chalcone isomerase-like protein